MSDAKSAEHQCEYIHLFPTRPALANRLNKALCPPYWPKPFGSHLPEVPHWGYACRFLRSGAPGGDGVGWVYVYEGMKIHEYKTVNGKNTFCNSYFIWKMKLETKGGGGESYSIPVPKNTEGYIAYSEHRWWPLRIKEMLEDGGKRAKRMQPFSTDTPDPNYMIPIGPQAWEVIEEMRDIPNGLSCMGLDIVDGQLFPRANFRQLCYHGIEHYGKIHVNWTQTEKTENIRLRHLSGEAQNRHCYSAKKPIPSKYPHHISWHGSDPVQPFVSIVGTEQHKVMQNNASCGFVIMLNDEVGICRELFSLCRLAEEDEALFNESIRYPHTIANYIDALKEVTDIIRYIRPQEDTFANQVQTVLDAINDYYKKITDARAVWMSAGGDVSVPLVQCFQDLLPEKGQEGQAKSEFPKEFKSNLESAEARLADILHNIARLDFGLALADAMFGLEYKADNLLWQVINARQGVDRTKEDDLNSIATHLFRYLSADKECPQREKLAQKLGEAYNDRNIVPMALTAWSREMLYTFACMLRGPEIPPPSVVLPVYLTEQQMQCIRTNSPAQYGEFQYIPRPLPVAEQTKPPAASVTEVYLPELVARQVEAAFSSRSLPGANNESIATYLDLDRENIKPAYRILVSLLGGYSLYNYVRKEDTPATKYAAATVTGIVLFTGLAEWYFFKNYAITSAAFGVANKLLGAIGVLWLSGENAEAAWKALQEEKYAKALSHSITAVGTGLLGYKSVVMALEQGSTKAGWAWAGRYFSKLPFAGGLAKCNPYFLALFVGAELIMLAAEAGEPLNAWARDCVWGKRVNDSAVDIACAMTPVLHRGDGISRMPNNPDEQLHKEALALYRAVHQPRFSRITLSSPTVDPIFCDNVIVPDAYNYEKAIEVTFPVFLDDKSLLRVERVEYDIYGNPYGYTSDLRKVQEVSLSPRKILLFPKTQQPYSYVYYPDTGYLSAELLTGSDLLIKGTLE